MPFDVFIESKNYQEFIPSALTKEQLWIEKAGQEVLRQIWSVPGKGETPDLYALAPEITGIVQEIYRTKWSKSLPKPIKLWYLTRCYRYERPQSGRYREFWQFGVERLGPYNEQDIEETYQDLLDILDGVDLPQNARTVERGMIRGLAYYTRQDRNLEIRCVSLGAQKQIAGGGCYEEGVGWAIGVERLILALRKTSLLPE